jgi:transposase
MSCVEEVRTKYELLRNVLDEAAARMWAATEAQAIGRGGIEAVSQATGMSRRRIREGLRQRKELAPPTSERTERRIRRPGAGRKALTERDTTLKRDLQALVDPSTRGDPRSPLRWTSKSLRELREALEAKGHVVSRMTIGRLLHELGYSLQATRKVNEGKQSADRDAQFLYINERAAHFMARGQPVISVDTKKKELVGDFHNAGHEWQPQGNPTPVRVHDFLDKELGKAVPYGVYDLANNVGWVSVGTDHDTAEFAVETIRRWWREMGRSLHPNAKELLITADGGGSNSSRTWLWKLELQKLADATGLTISVCHYPPGTSKWNKIEHRMFCHITRNWRGRPLESVETIVSLIAATHTETGLTIRAAADTDPYETGRKVTQAELKSLALRRAEFHGDWNYAITPRKRS